MMGRLVAIPAILGAAARLDGEEAAHLDAVGIEVSAMNGMSGGEEVVERCFVKCQRLGACPVVADL